MKRKRIDFRRIIKNTIIEIKRMYIAKNGILIICTVCLIVGASSGYRIGTQKEAKKAKKEIAIIQKETTKENAKLTENKAKSEAQETKVAESPWNLILVNSTHPLDGAYVPELIEVAQGYSVDARIADPLNQMLADANNEGLHMIICSAYRSLDYQKEVFSQTMMEHINAGSSYYDAYLITSQSVAVPGQSEHALGLAVDIVSGEYELLDEQQANTKEAQWLAANSYKYGFILRYPQAKIQETGIIYEPWHYRYVGKEAAKEIQASGVTFEQYLGEE